MLSFFKMTGAGNDFIMVDNRDLEFTPLLRQEVIEALCDRRFGIGADGLIAAEPAENGADMRMRYYNSDGGEAEMCGNGARCFTAFVNFLTDGELNKLSFETMAGLVYGEMNEDETVTIGLTTPKDLKLNALAPSDEVPTDVHFINTGVPHAVAFLDDVSELDVEEMGAFLRYHEAFAPAGTNANFASITGLQSLDLRTYERGVEGETLACGTGLTATALIHALLTDAPSPISVEVASGATLSVDFEREGEQGFSNVSLTGPADMVFGGYIELDLDQFED